MTDFVVLAVDLFTGFRSKQVLTAPVVTSPGRVAGILQCVNTRDQRSFDADDQALITVVCEQLVRRCMSGRPSLVENDLMCTCVCACACVRQGQVLGMQRAQYQLANADTSYLRTHSLREPIRIGIHSATIGRAHNHLRCTAQVLHGGVQLGKTLSVPLTPTRSVRVESKCFCPDLQLDRCN